MPMISQPSASPSIHDETLHLSLRSFSMPHAGIYDYLWLCMALYIVMRQRFSMFASPLFPFEHVSCADFYFCVMCRCCVYYAQIQTHTACRCWYVMSMLSLQPGTSSPRSGQASLRSVWRCSACSPFSYVLWNFSTFRGVGGLC